MIVTLQGTVSEKLPDALVLEVAGVGYEVMVTATDYGAVAVGAELRYYIHDHIREDAHNLYGFSERAAKGLFELLLGISGVGPKVAMAVLSSASLAHLQAAIGSGDADALRGVAGVGKKTAERIALELRGKLLPGSGGASLATQSDGVYQALIGLGYAPAQASAALAEVPATVTDEQARIKAALKALS